MTSPASLRTGKRLNIRSSEIAIRFKQAPYALFRDTPVDELDADWLILRIQPDEGIRLRVNAKRPGPAMTLESVSMRFNYKDYFHQAPAVGYETLIYDCLIGDATLFQRADQVEAAWSLVAPVLDALKADGIPVSLDSYQPATQAYALSRGVAYLNDIRGFPDAAFYPQLAKSSAKLVVMHSVQDGQADRREAPAGDIMDHIAAFFDARIAALTGAGIKRNRLVLDPGMGFFLGAAPETSLSVLARFDELRLRFDLPVLLSVSRKSFLRALTGRGPGDVGAATLAAELAAAAGGADFIRTHEPRPLRDGLAVLAALKETARIR